MHYIRGLYSKELIAGDGYGEMKMAYGNQICTTHTQNLPFQSFRSKFWHCRWIRRLPFPIWYGYFSDRWIFTMWPWPLTFWPWTCVTCCAPHWDNFYQVSPSQLIRSWPTRFYCWYVMSRYDLEHFVVYCVINSVRNLRWIEQSTAEFLVIQPVFKVRFSGDYCTACFSRVGDNFWHTFGAGPLWGWEIRHIIHTNFSGGNFVLPNCQS